MLVVGSWVARHGRGRGAFRWVGARRGIRWVPLHSNPPLEADGDLPPCPRWDCCRFHACGRGMVEDCTAAGRMSSCIKYIVFICAFCAKSPLVRMRSPVQIRIAAPETHRFQMENGGFLLCLTAQVSRVSISGGLLFFGVQKMIKNVCGMQQRRGAICITSVRRKPHTTR